MRLSTWVKLAAFLWLIGEILAFTLAVKAIGLFGTLLLGLLTSLIGLALLKRTGAAAKIKLRAVMSGRGDAPPDGFVDEALGAFGAVALILPGFLSDIVGVTLALPVLRARASGWVRKGFIRFQRTADPASSQGPGSIDLEPGEWHRTDRPSSPLTRSGIRTSGS